MQHRHFTPQIASLTAFTIVIALLITRGVSGGEISAADISQIIDRRLGTGAETPTQFAEDTDFLRRVTLDLAGRIPTIAEVHEFTANPSESHRGDAIRRLMHSGVYYRNMATFWRRAWVPQADTREFAAVTDDFELWLIQRLREQKPYDQLVEEVLLLDHSQTAGAGAIPVGFYTANQSKPENLAASSTRAFLGINLDCAQCHNHPFSRWTREQFWQTAAFFAQPVSATKHSTKPPKVRVPDTDLEYEPALLSSEEIHWPEKLDSVSLRQVLVKWIKGDQEHLLAKNAVNRLWSHYFGEAIIEPMDDLSRDEFQTGERAELLNELSRAFIASGYNLDLMVAGMTGSDAYRLATDLPSTNNQGDSAPSEISANTPASLDTSGFHLTHAEVRGLSGEQLYDSLQTAAGLPAVRSDISRDAGRTRREFSSQFYVERPSTAERSISQALTLMNGSLVSQMSTSRGNPMLASIIDSPFMSPDDQITTVFMAVLSRPAREEELATVKRHFETNSASNRESQLGNLFWVLVNSPEFNTNH